MKSLPSALKILSSCGLAVLILAGCGDSQESAMEQLLKKDYQYSVDQFLIAASNGDLETVHLFHEAGMGVNVQDAEGDTALMRSVANGHEDVEVFLLEHGADPKILNARNRSALIYAGEKGYTAAVRQLLKHGADATIKDDEGWSALTAAAFNGHSECVELLAGNSPKLLDDALLISCFQGDPAVVDHLLTHGAYVNTRSPAGQTPLMIAAENGHLDAVRMLTENRANRFAVDEAGRTAADLADVKGFDNISLYLNEPPDPERPISGTAMMDEYSARETLEVLGGEAFDEGFEPARAPLAGDFVLEDGDMEAGLMEPIELDRLEGAVIELPAEPAAGNGLAMAEPEVIGEEPLPVFGAAAAAPGAMAATPNAAPSEPEKKKKGAKAKDTEKAAAAASTPPATVAAAATANDVPPAKPEPGKRPAAAQTDAKANTTVAAAPAQAAAPATPPSDPGHSPLKAMYLDDYRESPLPMMLKGVEGDTASVRLLYGDSHDVIQVREGERIGDTGYQAIRISTQMVSSKQGKGHLVDVSRMLVEDVHTGAKHLLVKDVAGRSSETYAVLRVKDRPNRYVVRPSDRFVTLTERGESEFVVLDIRPTQVVIEEEGTGNVYTIERQGIVMK